MARLRAALRHRLQQQGADAIFASDDLSVDLVRRLVRRGGEDVKLSPKEYDILEQLVIHAGKVLTHKHLLREVWRDESVDPQYLRVYVRQLRQKIEADPVRTAARADRARNRLPAGVTEGAIAISDRMEPRAVPLISNARTGDTCAHRHIPSGRFRPDGGLL